MHLPVVDVAVSIVRAPDGRVLVAERTARQTAAGFWELPGGKIDAGETAQAAAARELHEEIGIHPHALRPWIRYEHAFRTKRVRLTFFRVDAWDGHPHGREGQRVEWIEPAAPHVAPILPSNERVLAALALPPWYAVIAGDDASDPAATLARLPALLASGTRLIQLRAPALAPAQRVALARRTAHQAAQHGARVLLAGTALEAKQAGVAGVHSTAQGLSRAVARPAVPLWGVSCHDARDLQQAVALGADFAVLAPVLPAASHPGMPALGWDGLRRLAADAPLPVYAQGGLGREHIDEARRAGAVGVASAAFADAGAKPGGR